jgi:hypothetical protein
MAEEVKEETMEKEDQQAQCGEDGCIIPQRPPKAAAPGDEEEKDDEEEEEEDEDDEEEKPSLLHVSVINRYNYTEPRTSPPLPSGIPGYSAPGFGMGAGTGLPLYGAMSPSLHVVSGIDRPAPPTTASFNMTFFGIGYAFGFIKGRIEEEIERFPADGDRDLAEATSTIASVLATIEECMDSGNKQLSVKDSYKLGTFLGTLNTLINADHDRAYYWSWQLIKEFADEISHIIRALRPASES